MALPNTIIAGAPKSGSSSLYWWLSAHPEVCASKVKETHFFSDSIVPKHNGSANVIKHDLSVYEKYFNHCDPQAKVIAEATPIYIYQKNPLEHLQSLPSKPKLLFVLREPSIRAHSQFRFNKHRLGNVDASTTYDEYLSQLKGTASDPLQRGHYINYLVEWLKVFGHDRMLILQFEQLFSDRVKWMKQVSEFLGIAPGFYDEFDFVKRNETRKMRSTKLHHLGLRLQPLVPQVLQEKVIIPLYLKLNSSAMPSVSAEDKEHIERLKPMFKESNELLAETFSTIDLSLWK